MRSSTKPHTPRGSVKREDQRGGAEADEVPDAGAPEPGFDGEEDDRAEDRAFEVPSPPTSAIKIM